MEGRAAGTGPPSPHNGKTQYSSRPSAEVFPHPPDSIRQERGKPAEGLTSYRASRPCAPPARIHLSMAKKAARCMSPRSTLRCPMHRTPLSIAPHSIPSARTTLLLHHRISPSGTPHPWLHQKPARYAEEASERNREPPHSTRSSPFHDPQSQIPDCHKAHSPSQNSLFKFPIQCIS